MTAPQSSFSKASPVMLPPWLSQQVDDEGERIALRQAAEFFELLDFFRPEIVGADPLGFLEGKLQLHRLSGGLFEVDGDFFGREIPVDHLAGTEGFMNTKISGSQLRKALADRFGNATGFNQFRHVRMHAAEDGKPSRKTQGIPLINLSESHFHGFSVGGGTTRGRGCRWVHHVALKRLIQSAAEHPDPPVPVFGHLVEAVTAGDIRLRKSAPPWDLRFSRGKPSPSRRTSALPSSLEKLAVLSATLTTRIGPRAGTGKDRSFDHFSGKRPLQDRRLAEFQFHLERLAAAESGDHHFLAGFRKAQQGGELRFVHQHLVAEFPQQIELRAVRPLGRAALHRWISPRNQSPAAATARAP